MDYSKQTKAELVAALEERDSQIAELSEALDKTMSRLTESEKVKPATGKTTVIDAGEEGELMFSGHGIKYKGTFYSAQDLKNNPEIAVALYENGSGLIKKIAK